MQKPNISKPVEAIILKKVQTLKTREDRLQFLRAESKRGTKMPKGYTKMRNEDLHKVCLYAWAERALALYKKSRV